MERIRRSLSQLSLAQQFMLASLVVLVIGMVGLSTWVGQPIERGVINRTAGQTALYVDSFINLPLQELAHGDSLTPKYVTHSIAW